MEIIIHDLKCKNCGKFLNIWDGDILQIIQEMLDSLNCSCNICGHKNEIEIKKVNFQIIHVE